LRVLVVAAHPDDEVLGCGATIARLVSEGHEVRITIMGEGVTSRSAAREDADASAVAALAERARDAVAILGASEVRLHGLPDNRFDSLDLLDVVKLVEADVAAFEPPVIFTHHGGDLNIDHVIVHRAVLTATRPLAGSPVRDVCAFEVPSATEWAFQRFEPTLRPNFFVDVAATLETKLAAMEVYDSEARPFPHPRSPEALRAIAARWGSVSGQQAAEAFEIVRAVRPPGEALLGG
jgi:LmbE family N-acetylglucosaminyl deacetylase